MVGLILLGIAIIVVFSLPLWSSTNSGNDTSSDIKIVSKKELLKLPGVKQAVLVFVLYCGLEFTTGMWASTYAVIRYELPVATAAMWGSLFFVGVTIGRIISGFISTVISNKQLINLGVCIVTIGIVLTMLPFGQMFSLVGLIVTGLGCAPIFPSMMHETPKNFGKEYSQSIIGLQMIGAMLGSLFIPSLFGLIGDIVSYEVMPYFTGIMLVLMFITVRGLYKNVEKV